MTQPGTSASTQYINSRGLFFIIVVVGLIVVAEILLFPFYRCQVSGPLSKSILARIFLGNIAIYLTAGVLGLYFASRLNLPLWYSGNSGLPDSRQVSFISLLLGLGTVAANTLYMLSLLDQAQVVDQTHWFFCLTPRTAAALSFKAALTEEIFFRLFLFPVITWAFDHFLHLREVSLVFGALLSQFFFGIYHGQAMLVAFFVGFSLIYIYYKRGLVPVMVIHFFADAIPFVLISMRL